MLHNSTPLECFYHWEKTAADQVYLRQPRNGDWIEYTWSQIGDRVRRVATYLKGLDLEPGSRVCIFSSNSADWVTVDLAIMLAGYVNVPLYPGQDLESAAYILEHSDCKAMFLGAVDQAQAVADGKLANNIPVVAIEGCPVQGQTSIDSVLESNAPFEASPIPNKEDFMTILYTSGTTGNPKGVVHLHGTPEKVVPRLIETWSLDKQEERPRYFSFLPMSHAAERIAVEMVSFYLNPIVSFSAGLETFSAEIASVQPTFFFAVPRLWVKFKAAIEAAVPPAAFAQLGEEQKAGIRQKLGLSKAVTVITGSAPTPVDVHEWFQALGVDLREGYGMTENFVDGSFFYDDLTPPPGCAGRCLPGTEVKISDEGEIMFKSAGLMHSYYLNPEKTAEVIEDGWYHTGDMGRIDEKGWLWVTGRLSETFKTSKGKFIQPVNIESLLGRIPSLGQFCILGHGQDKPSLLCSLSEVGAGMSQNDVKAQIEAGIAEVNSELMAHEEIGEVLVTNEDWRIDNGLLTPTMKLKRKKIEERYGPLLSKSIELVTFE